MGNFRKDQIPWGKISVRHSKPFRVFKIQNWFIFASGFGFFEIVDNLASDSGFSDFCSEICLRFVNICTGSARSKFLVPSLTQRVHFSSGPNPGRYNETGYDLYSSLTFIPYFLFFIKARLLHLYKTKLCRQIAPSNFAWHKRWAKI